MQKTIYIVDGARTPFLKSRNRPGPCPESAPAPGTGKVLLARQPFEPGELDEVILGCAAPSVDEVNIGRVAALRMGCGLKVPGWTVMRNCASGMQSIDSGIANMMTGRSELVLAGGVDALSRAPLLYSDRMVTWFSRFMAARTPLQKAGMFLKLSPAQLLAPVVAIMKGLTDPVVGLLMGQTAENLAWRFGITREQMDEYSARSHARVIRAQQSGWLTRGHDGLAAEIVPVYDADGNLYADDDGVRSDSTAENLAKLKPFFDRKYGNVTAGNSSQITDGGAWVVLASEEAVQRHGLAPVGRILDAHWAIRWAPRARASCCICCTCSSAPAAARESLRSASAAAWAALCSSKRFDRHSRSCTNDPWGNRTMAHKHWKLDTDRDNIAWLTFDKAEASTNTLSGAVVAEFSAVLDELRASNPRALVIRSGKSSGFIAGAEVEEFTAITSTDDALAIVRRGWDVMNKLAAPAFPTLALVNGFCIGGGPGPAPACRH